VLRVAESRSHSTCAGRRNGPHGSRRRRSGSQRQAGRHHVVHENDRSVYRQTYAKSDRCPIATTAPGMSWRPQQRRKRIYDRRVDEGGICPRKFLGWIDPVAPRAERHTRDRHHDSSWIGNPPRHRVGERSGGSTDPLVLQAAHENPCRTLMGERNMHRQARAHQTIGSLAELG